MSRIISYRGLLADGAQDTILLSTKKGEAGYRIVKFQIMPNTPGATPFESVAKIYKVEQTAIDGVIDFSDNTLLAAAYGMGNEGTAYVDGMFDIIFDQEIINQDMYITNKDVDTGMALNYYIELEQIKLNEHEAMVATIQNIRNG